MTQQQTERDETPIDEKRILADILEAITKLGTVGPWHDDLLRAAMLLRGDEPAKPDRYVVAWNDAYKAWNSASTGTQGTQAAAAVLRRHFAPPSEVVEAARFYDVPISRAGSILARFVLSLQDGAPITGQPLALITDEQIKQITNRFLGWKLPEDFHPDDGISFEPEFNKEWNAAQGKPPQRRTPTGTNLFSYTQAEAMVRFILADFILKGDV